MKELFKMLTGAEEHFTTKEIIVYGILFPMGLIALCVIADNIIY